MKATTMRATLISAVLVVLLLFVAVGDVKAATPYTTITMDFGWAMADSIFPRYNYVTVIGYNGAIQINADDDISELGANVIPYPTITDTLRLVSGSADDAAAGTGARDVEIYGLDANWNEQSEHFTMAGTDTVQAANFYRRINNMYIYDVGSGGVAAGAIVLTNGAGDTTYAKITAGETQDLTAHFTIPSGKQGFITGWSAGAGSTKPVRFLLNATVDIGDRSRLGLFHSEDIILVQGSNAYIPFPIPIELPDRCDVKITGFGVGGAGEGTASVYIYYK